MALRLAHVESSSEAEPRWWPLKEAARLLELDRGHLGRLCRDRYDAQGLARKIDGEWYISPHVDNRLKTDDPARRDLDSEAELAREGVPTKQIDRAVAIRDLIRRYETFDARGLTAHDAVDAFLKYAHASGWTADIGNKKPGRTTFYTWQSKYAEHGLAGLVRRSKVTTEIQRGESALTYIENLVNAGNRISIKKAIVITTAEAKEHPDDPAWEIPSYSKIRLHLQSRRPQILKVVTDKGTRAARAQLVPHAQRGFEHLAVNDEWNGDEAKLDVMYRTLTSRGWQARRDLVLTAWQDIRSRAIVGFVLAEHADSNTILGSLKIGFQKFGVPKRLRCDWGKDYQKATGTGKGKRFKSKGIKEFNGQRIASILDRLDVAVHPVLPYRPESKPIESFFRTLHKMFEQQFPSYWGGNAEMRHDDRHKWVKRNLEKLPTLDELAALLPLAIDAYHQTIHSATDMFGKTPLQAVEDFQEGAIRRESKAVLDHLFRTFEGPRQVRRDGIRFNNRWYRDPLNQHVPLIGQKVLLAFDPANMGKAMVCEVNDDRTPLFEVECQSLEGFTAQDAKQIARDQAKVLRPFADQARSARRLFESMSPQRRLQMQLEGAIERSGDRDATTPRDPHNEDAPVSIRLHSTLEESISKAPRIAPDVESNEAVRTGTDDITLDDILGDDDAPPLRTRRADEEPPEDFFGFDDPEIE